MLFNLIKYLNMSKLSLTVSSDEPESVILSGFTKPGPSFILRAL